ncbi:hypothetical protein PsorP6_008240 [Peronosclerospora sorghi]|uniref:Uncharacterized protein n=1 Tax=Peronosclerospora sorghi TaxID=230839 RepID=A0ACC0WBH7_9STRA|nr:hypothetical protein PsorP6_008240 [Peronosclerospora sorghi]
MGHSAVKKKARNRKKKRSTATIVPPPPVATPSSSSEGLEEVLSVSSQSAIGSNSTARRSFSSLSRCSSESYSSEEARDDNDEDEYSSGSEDEGESNYKPGGYHRVQIGEVYNSRFEVLEKLGWGHFSTVWKCLDRQTGDVVAMKVQKSARHYTEAARDEIELLECSLHAIRTEFALPEQQEAVKVIRLVDSFEHEGRNGVHVCMVFEMMGDNLLTLIKYYNYRGVPLLFAKRLTRDMLEGLAFLHDKCQIIHTDLKPENVLLSHHIPRLPKLRKSQWEAFRAMRLARHEKEAKGYLNGGLVASAAGREMSKEEKKRLKNRLKKKRQKQRKQLQSGQQEEADAASIIKDSTVRSTVPTVDSSVDALSTSLSQVTISTSVCTDESIDEAFAQNFETKTSKDDTTASLDASRICYRHVGNPGDEEDKDWVHLPPEFAARVMLLLPEGRVAGSRQKEREFTLTVAASQIQTSVESKNDIKKEDDVVETSFFLRYLDHVDDELIKSLEEQVVGVHNDRKKIPFTQVKYRVWKLEFDARYTHAVLDYLEHRIEGLRFLNIAPSSGLALPGFFFPNPPSNQDIQSAAANKTLGKDYCVSDVVIQGINLAPLTSAFERVLEVKPLQERLSRWACPLHKLITSDMFEIFQLNAKICDLGNACWTTKHFTSDIQTRQYRCPEVILGKQYDTAADIWSMACFVFELVTGDLLFDPKSGRKFNRDEDHLAQMIELLGRMPKSFTASQRGLREFFTRKGELKRIRNLKFWSLEQVLIEKYHFLRHDAECLASFLTPMLRYEPSKRATAVECLAHPWLAHVDGEGKDCCTDE